MRVKRHSKTCRHFVKGGIPAVGRPKNP